jgi:hypothetical protein
LHKSTGLNGEGIGSENISDASSESVRKGLSSDKKHSPTNVPTKRVLDKRSNLHSSMPVPNSGSARDSNRVLITANTGNNVVEEDRAYNMNLKSHQLDQRSDKFHGIEPYNEKKTRGFYRSEFPRLDGKIYELVLLRRSSTVHHLKWACRKIQF